MKDTMQECKNVDIKGRKQGYKKIKERK